MGEGFVLAGGLSARMGVDKATLPWSGGTLASHAVETLRGLGLRARFAGSRPDLETLAESVRDRRMNAGPLAGMEAALAASESALNLFLPVDVPLLPPYLLMWMLERAAITGAAATIPRMGGRPQPLCGVYRRELLPGLVAALDGGERKVLRAVAVAAEAQGAAVDFVHAEEVWATRFEWPAEPPVFRWFDNLNTAADFALAVRDLPKSLRHPLI